MLFLCGCFSPGWRLPQGLRVLTSVYFSSLLVPVINLLPLSCTFSFVAWSVKVDPDPLNTKFVLPGIHSPHPRIPFGFLFPYLYLLSYHCLIILYMKLPSLNYRLLSVFLLDPHCPKHPPLENWRYSSACSNPPCCQPASYKERSLGFFSFSLNLAFDPVVLNGAHWCFWDPRLCLSEQEIIWFGFISMEQGRQHNWLVRTVDSHQVAWGWILAFLVNSVILGNLPLYIFSSFWWKWE